MSALVSGEATPVLNVAGTTTHLLLTAEQTNGAASMVRVEVPPGWVNPPHLHWFEDESFYVLDGELEVTVNDDVIRLTVGQAAFGPRRVPHSFRNPTDQSAQVLITITPGGIERFFRAVAEAFPTGEVTDVDRLLHLINTHGMTAIEARGSL